MRTTSRIAVLVAGLAAAVASTLAAFPAVALAQAGQAGRQGGAGAGPAPTETLSQTYRGSRRNDIEYQKIPPFKSSTTSFT